MLEISEKVEAFVDKVHNSPYQGVIAVTGCSSLIVDLLLSRGGGSKTLLDARVPYSTEALKRFIGHTPKKFCSDEVAKELASSAYSLATELREEDITPVFGLGITATLRKKGPERKGRIHNVYISFQTHQFTYSHQVVLDPEIAREHQDFYVGLLALAVLCQQLGEGTLADLKRPKAFSPSGGQVVVEVKESTEKEYHPERLQGLLSGEECLYTPLRNGDFLTENRVVIPGSFNPFHQGHRKMVEYALKLNKNAQRPVLEISITNVDKGKLSGFEVQKRINNLIQSGDAGRVDLAITNFPTAAEKAILFRNSTFIIGVDTWYRIIDPKYYNYSQEECEVALEAIRETGCDFLVLGRLVNGHFHTLPTDTTTRGLARGISEEEFRVDISSSQLRT